MKIAIIADDLTGANDTGVQLTNKGIPTAVRLDVAKIGSKGYDALVFDTDSRSDAASEAYRKVKQVCESVRFTDVELLYKKIDSTMRGNVGAELDALHDVYEPDFVIIAPAFPQNGRIVKNGLLYVDGMLLHETETSNDPKTPVTESYVPRLLAKQTKRRVGLVARQDLWSGREHVRRMLETWKGDDTPYVVFDAESTEDLNEIASVVRACGYRIAWCGSAGLAGVLAQGEPRLNAGLQPPTGGASSVLAVVGSISAKSRRQLDKLLRDPEVAGIEMRAEQLLIEDARAAEMRKAMLQARHSKGRHLVLYSSGGADDVERARFVGQSLGLDDKGVSDAVSAALGEAAAGLIRDMGITQTVLTGGDTAKQVCLHLGASELELIGEVESGAPLCRIDGAGQLYAITKAGGFGDETALVRYLDFYRGGGALCNQSLG